jgi:hypothetical protein
MSFTATTPTPRQSFTPPLTGPHGWRVTPGGPLTVLPAHRPVWNPAHQPHLIKAGPVPYLCVYGWTRDVNAPAYVIPAPDWAELQVLRLQPQ